MDNENRIKFWDNLAKALQGIDVLMGDFNMALFETIPELRRRGVIIDLAAWFPWRTLQGVPCADSCAIFFVDKSGKYCLNYGLADLHDNDETGILFSDVAASGSRCC